MSSGEITLSPKQMVKSSICRQNLNLILTQQYWRESPEKKTQNAIYPGRQAGAELEIEAAVKTEIFQKFPNCVQINSKARHVLSSDALKALNQS